MVPTEDPATYEDVLQPLVDNIEDETGRDVVVDPLNFYAAQIEAMNADRLHIAGFAAGATPFAVNIAGAVPFGIQVADGTFGYRLGNYTGGKEPIRLVRRRNCGARHPTDGYVALIARLITRLPVL